MQLLELTPAEIDFLKAESAVSDKLQQRLALRLATTLTARLRMPVRLQASPTDEVADAPAAPAWHPDAELTTLWLTRRLGGQRVVGVASFVPRTLIDTLDETLAECWFDMTLQDSLPAALAWLISAGTIQARLELRLPHLTTNMTRWARGVIQRV